MSKLIIRGVEIMDFLTKLNILLKKNDLNKNTLSKMSGISYTTIDGWYKKGYENMRVPTLKNLSEFFNVSLDYWIDYNDNSQTSIKNNNTKLNHTEKNLIKTFRETNSQGQELIVQMANAIKNQYIKSDSVSNVENVTEEIS